MPNSILCPACGEDTLQIMADDHGHCIQIQAPPRLCGEPMVDRFGDPCKTTPQIPGQYPRTLISCTGNRYSQVAHVKNGERAATFRTDPKSGLTQMVTECRYSGSLSPVETQQLLDQIVRREGGLIR